MARQHSKDIEKYVDDEVMIVGGGSVVVQFEKERNKTIMGTYSAGGSDRNIIFWGDDNAQPEEREALLSNNNIVPQIIRAKRDIILGGGLYTYTERYEDGERIIDEVDMPTQFSDFIQQSEEDWGGLVEMCNDLLKHGQYFVELDVNNKKEPAYIRPHIARYVRAEKQTNQGKIPRYWLSTNWSKVYDQQRLDEKITLQSLNAYDRKHPLKHSMYQGADRLLGGPYYYEPHYAGSQTWIKVANIIPQFHLGNLQNGFNIRYLIRVPEDYFLRSISTENRKDTTKLKVHLQTAKKNFKDKLNNFLQGAENAGRGLIVTKHIYKHLQKEWPELEIIPLQVDLKDEAMLKLFDSSNQAATSAHGIPPVLAGLATGAKMTSGSEVRNMYNFWQITATPTPRAILLKPYQWAWNGFKLDAKVKLGFRNMELTTTDKNPNGTNPTIDQQNEV